MKTTGGENFPRTLERLDDLMSFNHSDSDITAHSAVLLQEAAERA